MSARADPDHTSYEKGFLRDLDKAETEVINRIDRWLQSATRNMPWGTKTDKILNWVPRTSSLNNILAEHSGAIFAAGRAHGLILCRLARGELKLADYTLPEFNFDYDADPKVVPLQAIRALENRQMVLAGVFEIDLLTQIKKTLISHLGGLPRPEAEREIAEVLQSTRNRASLIVTTETTYAYNRGRLASFREANVDYVRFSAVMDARTSPQCRSRHGLVMAMDDPELAANTPPLHGHCRSVLTPIYSRYQGKYITAETTDWSNAKPLPKGWHAGD